MTSPGRLSGHLVRIAAVVAIASAGIGVSSAPAQAAVTGFGGPVGVQQTVNVTGTSPNLLGQSTCTVVPTINGVAQLPATGAPHQRHPHLPVDAADGGGGDLQPR